MAAIKALSAKKAKAKEKARPQIVGLQRRESWEIYAPLAPSLSPLEIARLVKDTRSKLYRQFEAQRAKQTQWGASSAATMRPPGDNEVMRATEQAVIQAEQAARASGRRPYADMPAAVQSADWGTQVSWKTGAVSAPSPSAISSVVAAQATGLVNQGIPASIVVPAAARVASTAMQVASTPAPTLVPIPETVVPAPSPYAVLSPMEPATSSWGEGNVPVTSEEEQPFSWDEFWSRWGLDGMGSYVESVPWWVYAGVGAALLWWWRRRKKS